MLYEIVSGHHGIFVKNDRGEVEKQRVGPGDVVTLTREQRVRLARHIRPHDVPATVDLDVPWREVVESVLRLGSVEEVESVVAAEREGKDRKSVIRAAEERIEELQR